MKNSRYPILLLLLLFTVRANAQGKEPEHKIDAALTQCLDKEENQSTAGMCNCQYEVLEKWDKELNATYKKLLAKLDSNAKAKLVEAQREWLQFKEKEIALIDATTFSGTMYLVIRAERVTDITKKRATDLAALLEMLIQK